MLLANHKTICLIGFPQSTVTQEAQHFIKKEFTGEIVIRSPEEFAAIEDKTQYQYGVAFTLDQVLRRQIIDIVENENLDCIRYMHDSVVCYTDDPGEILGRGSFVAPFSTVLFGAVIGNHCIIEANCLVAHHVVLGNNVVLHAGTMIAGRTRVGSDCVFNFRSAAINALDICDGVTVGSTSTLTKSVVKPGVWIGTPARCIGSAVLEQPG